MDAAGKSHAADTGEAGGAQVADFVTDDLEHDGFANAFIKAGLLSGEE